MSYGSDVVQRQIRATSKHRAAYTPELSKMTSRDTAPFFVQNPTPNTGASIQGFPEKPRRHMMSPLSFGDKTGVRYEPQPKVDKRDYTPKTHIEQHPKCSVDIGRGPARDTSFGGGYGDANKSCTTELRVPSPKWGGSKESVSKKGTFSRGSREQGGAFSPPRSRTAMSGGLISTSASGGSNSGRRSRTIYTDVEKTILTSNNNVSGGAAAASSPSVQPGGGIDDDMSGEAGGGSYDRRPGSGQRRSRSAMLTLPPDPSVLESRYSGTKGGTISKADDRAMLPAPDRPALKVNEDSVSRNKTNVSLGRGTGRNDRENKKQAAKYLAMFRLPPPAPLAAPEKRRTFGGYAPQRFNARGTDIQALLRASESDVKRSRQMTDLYFRIERSQLRSSLLYTPGGGASMLGSSNPPSPPRDGSSPVTRF